MANAGKFTYDPQGDVIITLPHGVTRAMVDASLAANPNASKGGYGVAGPSNTKTGPVLDVPAMGLSPASSGSKSTQKPIVDWTSYLNLFGLPDDVRNKVNEIFANTADVNVATQLALGYIRGTSWYADTYPGIQEGLAKGIVSNEADYRSLLNQQTQLYKQYFGRDISAAEFATHLQEGVSTDTLGRRFQGAAYAAANKTDIQYLAGNFGGGQLSEAELKALGEENAGIDTELGQRLQQRLGVAQRRLQGVFSGTLASPSWSLAGGRLRAPSLSPSGDTPDIAA